MNKVLGKRFMVLLVVMTMMFSSMITVFATSTGQNTANVKTASDAYQKLIEGIKDPSKLQPIFAVKGNSTIDYAALPSKQYKNSGGGYSLYAELIKPTNGNVATDIVNENLFAQLTIGSKQDFVQDLFTVANAIAYATEKSPDMVIYTNGANTDTVNQLYTYLETKEGMGTVLMASIMENTKPNFAAANKIYAPFSGTIGTILGLISIIIMALLGVTMALDIAYIVIPTVQLMLDGAEGSGGGPGGPGGHGGGGKKGLSGLVSQAAKNAVQAAGGGQGGNGQGGEANKMAIGVYFKYRWLELIVLGICLLYLVSGNIYSFVAWILDLVSGFLGF